MRDLIRFALIGSLALAACQPSGTATHAARDLGTSVDAAEPPGLTDAGVDASPPGDAAVAPPTLPPYPVTTIAPTGASIAAQGCNSVSFSQIPGELDLFVSRELMNTTSDPCSGSNQYLALHSYDWNGHLNEVGSILLPPFDALGGTVPIISAYDASVAKLNGETWIAFECADSTAVNACAAPLLPDHQVDTSRLSVVIRGTPASAAGWHYSASVPKLLVWQGKIILYWTMVQVSHAGAFGSLTVRGTELGMSASGALFPAGRSAPVDTNDASTVEVFGADSTTTLADAYQAFSFGDYVYLNASKGPAGCTSPISTIPGCYRMALLRTQTPLAYHAFNAEALDQSYLPAGSASYSRYVQMPDGSMELMSLFLPNGDASLTGLYLMKLPDAPFFQDATQLAQTVPAQMKAGTPQAASVSVLNAGLIPFTETNWFRLGSIGPDSMAWGFPRAYLGAGQVINPGTVGVYDIAMTAPPAGSYTFEWQMLQETVDWFGIPAAPTVVTVTP